MQYLIRNILHGRMHSKLSFAGRSGRFEGVLMPEVQNNIQMLKQPVSPCAWLTAAQHSQPPIWRVSRGRNKMPKLDAYMRIISRTVDGKKTKDQLSPNERKVLIHAYARLLSTYQSEVVKSLPDTYMTLYFALSEHCKSITPREFEGIFPISKEFDGDRWGTKDYFFTKKMMIEFGEDVPLSENVAHFLFDYKNPIVSKCVINSMSAMSAIRRKQGKKELFESFMEICRFKTGVDTQIVANKLQAGIDGLEWLVLNTEPDEERKQQLVEALVEYDGIEGFISRARRSLQEESERSITDFMVLRDLLTHLSLMRERNYDEYFKLLLRLCSIT